MPFLQFFVIAKILFSTIPNPSGSYSQHVYLGPIDAAAVVIILDSGLSIHASLKISSLTLSDLAVLIGTDCQGTMFITQHTWARLWQVGTGNAQCTPMDWQSAVGDIANISPTGDWKSALVGRCVRNADPIVGTNRRYSADSKFESALEPVGASR